MGRDLDHLLARRSPRLIRLCCRLFGPVLRLYFRARGLHLERIPSGAAILVANHGGGMGPGDLMFYLLFCRERGAQEPVYVLAHRLFMRLGLRRILARFGIAEASPENARAILERGHKLLVYPGGDHDSLRPFSQRREVRFGGRQGFLRLARDTGAPLVPVVTAGSHSTFIVLTQGTTIARWLRTKRWLGVRSFPVILCLPWILAVGPMFLLPYLPFPARITVDIGEPRHLAPAAGPAPQEQTRLDEAYAAITAEMSRMLAALHDG